MSDTEAKRPLLRLFPVLLLNLVAFGVAIPILPPLTEALGGSATDVGLIFGLQALGQFVMAPLWGRLSDRIGRKPVLLLTIAGAAAADALTALSPSLALLYVARLVAGLCAGNIATASALVADATPADKRSKGMAIIGISFGLGFTIGPALGGIVSHVAGTHGALLSHWGPLALLVDLGALDSRLPFWVASGLNLLTVLLGGLLLVEARAKTQAARTQRLADLQAMLGRTPVMVMCALFFVYTVSATILESTFYLFMSKRYGFNQAEVGYIFAGLGLLMALVQGGIGRIAARLGDRLMTGIGVGLMGIGLAMAPLWGALGWLMALLTISTVGRALAHPGAMSMTSKLARDEGENGQIMGVLQSAASLGRIVGPLIGGVAFERLSEAAPFYISGAILLVAGLWWWAMTRVGGASDEKMR